MLCWVYQCAIVLSVTINQIASSRSSISTSSTRCCCNGSNVKLFSKSSSHLSDQDQRDDAQKTLPSQGKAWSHSCLAWCCSTPAFPLRRCA